MNRLWASMLLLGLGYGVLSGRSGQVTEAVLPGAADGVELCLAMLGVMALWTGILEVGEKAGLIRRISYDTIPPKVEYVLTPSAEQLIPALDILYIWSIRRMDELRIPIDADAFVVHKTSKYVDELREIMEANDFTPDRTRQGADRSKNGL